MTIIVSIGRRTATKGWERLQTREMTNRYYSAAKRGFRTNPLEISLGLYTSLQSSINHWQASETMSLLRSRHSVFAPHILYVSKIKSRVVYTREWAFVMVFIGVLHTTKTTSTGNCRPIVLIGGLLKHPEKRGEVILKMTARYFRLMCQRKSISITRRDDADTTVLGSQFGPGWCQNILPPLQWHRIVALPTGMMEVKWGVLRGARKKPRLRGKPSLLSHSTMWSRSDQDGSERFTWSIRKKRNKSDSQ